MPNQKNTLIIELLETEIHQTKIDLTEKVYNKEKKAKYLRELENELKNFKTETDTKESQEKTTDSKIFQILIRTDLELKSLLENNPNKISKSKINNIREKLAKFTGELT
jgi:hypothetical protein